MGKRKDNLHRGNSFVFLGFNFFKRQMIFFFFFVFFPAFLVRMLAGCWGPRGSDKCQLIAIEEFNQEEKQAREKEEKEINGAHLVASRFDDSLIV